MINTQTQIDSLIDLAVLQRTELKQLVDSLPQLRNHLSSEIERNLEEIEPAIRAELEQFVAARALDTQAKTSAELSAKLDAMARNLESTTAAKYSVLMAERAQNAMLLAQAEARIAEAASALPGAVKGIVTDELARFPRAGEIDQLRKEFAEPRGLNPRGRWQVGETYNKLDLVSYNGDSYVSNTNGNREKPSRSSEAWTLSAARGNGGAGGGVTSLTDLVAVPANGELLIGNGSAFVNNTITGGAGVTVTNGPGTITIDASGAQELLTATVTNAESFAITRGQVVYLFGATGNRASVKLADNSNDAASSKTFGIVSQASISAGGNGLVTCVGVVTQLTLGTYTEGDVLYLAATPGEFTNVKPYAPNHLVYVGMVERANNGNGEMYVRIQNGFEIEELHNVQIITPPLAGSLLMRDATNSLWKANRLTGTANQVTVTNADTSVTLSLPTTVANVNSVTAATTQNLTLAGGSTGASLVLGQGASGNATLNVTNLATIVPSGIYGYLSIRSNNTANYSLFNIGSDPGSGYSFFDSGKSGTGTVRDIIFSFDGTRAATLKTTGNLLIGTTTDIAGSGGLKVAGTTAASSTTTGALQVSGGVGVGGAGYFGGTLSSSASTNGDHYIVASNSNAGTSAQTNLYVTTSGGGSEDFYLRKYGFNHSTRGHQAWLGTSGGLTTLTLAVNDVSALSFDTSRNATFAGAVTVNGTGTSTFAGSLSVGSASGSIGQNSITFPKIGGGSYANAFYLYNGNTTGAFGFSLYDTTAGAWRWITTNSGNFLIGTTTDIAGSGGLKVAGTTAASSTTSGALQVGANIGLSGNAGGASYFGGAGVFGGGTGAAFRLGQSLSAAVINNYGGASLETWANGVFEAPVLDFNKSRGGAIGNYTVVQNNDRLAYIVFRGSDGTVFRDAASIMGEVDGTPGASDMPGRIIFSTSPDGSANSAERMRISSTGVVNITGTTSASSSTVGALTIGNGSAATNVAIGGGAINAGGAGTFGNTLSIVDSLTIKTSNQTKIQFNDLGNTGAGFLIGRSLGGANTHDFFIYDLSATTNRFAINSTGLVSITSTAPSTGAGSGALQVAGGIYSGAASVFGANVSVLSNSASLYFGAASSSRITYNGSNTYFEAGGGLIINNGIGGSQIASINTSGDITAARDVGTTNGRVTATVTNTAGGSSATNYGIKIGSTMSQSGAADFRDLLINRTNTTPGGGTQLLIDAQTGGVSQFSVTPAGAATFAGTVIAPAATTAISSVRLPHGTAPTSPVNGDMWTTTAGLYVRINGVTVGPLS